jgi:DNA-binding transcriptional LysR family regulator
MRDRLSGIPEFVQVVESGSFAVAAERLNLTRSAVGKSIARLEQRLGARLFHRTTRQQSLTEEGQAFYDRCVRALSEIGEGEAQLNAGRREPSGVLRVSAPVLFGRHLVAPILWRLAQKHPQLNVEISFSDRVVDLLEEGFDLAVRIGSLADSSSLTSRGLGSQKMAVCASPAYLKRHGSPKTAADLADHTGIVYGRGNYVRSWPVSDGGKVQVGHVGSRLRFDDLQAIADAAIEGIGIAWLPCWMVSRYVREGQLKLVLKSDQSTAGAIHAVWPKTPYPPSKTRAAIDALVAEVPALIV